MAAYTLECGNLDSVGVVEQVGPVEYVSYAYTERAGVYGIGDDPDLELRYEFNEGSGTTVLDSSLNSNDGALTGGTYSTDTADGSSHSINLTTTIVRPASDVVVLGSAITLCCWVKNASSGADDGRYITRSTGGSTQDHDWMLGRYEYNAIRSRLRIGGSTQTYVADSQQWLPYGVWKHVAVTYDGASVQIYADGVSVETWSQTGTLTENGSAVVDIGGQSTNNSFPTGQIDDARVYKRALSTAEILAIFEGTEEPPPSEDLEGGSLDSVCAVNSGAITAAYALQGQSLNSAGEAKSGDAIAAYAIAAGDLDSAGAIQSGVVSVGYTLAGDDLDSIGAAQGVTLTVSYALSGDDLDSVGSIQGGATTASYTIAVQSLDSAGSIQSADIGTSSALLGGDLDSAGAIQSGAVSVGYILAGLSLDSACITQGGVITASYTIAGQSLDSAGAILGGNIDTSGALLGGDLDSVGIVQGGILSAAYTIAGQALDSAGSIQGGNVSATYTVAGQSLSCTGAIQSGEIASAYTLAGQALDSAGSVQGGELVLYGALAGGDLDSVGVIQGGILSAAYAIVGDSLDSAGSIKSTAFFGEVNYGDPITDCQVMVELSDNLSLIEGPANYLLIELADNLTLTELCAGTGG